MYFVCAFYDACMCKYKQYDEYKRLIMNLNSCFIPV